MWKLIVFVLSILAVSRAQIDWGSYIGECTSPDEANAPLVQKVLSYLPLLTQDDTLLNSEQINYIKEVVRFVDISKSPFGELIKNGGKFPISLNLEPERLTENVNAFIRGLSKQERADFSSGQLFSSKARKATRQPDWGSCPADYDAAYPWLGIVDLGYVVDLVTCVVLAYLNDNCFPLCSLVPPAVAPTPPNTTLPIYGFALTFLDAVFKPPTGLLEGKLHWPGSSDQCDGIEATYNITPDTTNTFNGKYCRISVGTQTGENETGGLALALGMCVPDTCATPDLKNFINENGLPTLLGLEVRSIFCGHDLDWGSDDEAQGSMALLVIIIITVVAATIWNAFIRTWWLRKYLDSIKPTQVSALHGETMEKEHNNGVVLTPVGSTPTSPMTPPPTYDNVTTHPLAMLNRQTSYVGVHPEDYRRFSSTDNMHPRIVSQISTLSTSDLVPNDVMEKPHLRQPHGQRSGYESNAMSLLERIPISFTDRLEAAFTGFSVQSSMRYIFSTKSNPHYFHSLDGIRVFSFMYGLYGLTYVLGPLYNEVFLAANLIPSLIDLPKSLTFQIILNHHFCADSFLVISGFLLTYKWMRRMAAKDNKITVKDVLYFYFHLYWKIMVPMMLVIMFYASFYKYLVSGPLIPPQIADAEACKIGWWKNLLMLHNLIDTDNMCLLWTFNVPVLFQLQLVTPLILVPLIKWPIVGIAVMVAMFISHIGATAGISADLYSGDRFLDNLGDKFGTWLYDILMAPWCRAGAYIIGVALGYLMFRVKRTLKMHWAMNLAGWMLTAACLLSVVFATHTFFKEGGTRWTEDGTIMYHTFARTAWGIAIAWIIVACETGNGGVAAVFLQWRAFMPLSKLTYMAVLMHAIFIFRNAYTQVSLIYITFNNMLYFAMGNLIITYGASWALALIFQFNFMGLEKGFLIKNKREQFLRGNSPIDDIKEKSEYLENYPNPSNQLYEDVQDFPKQSGGRPAFERQDTQL